MNSLSPINICKNCNQTLKTYDLFCFKCGAKKITYRITLKHLLQETSQRLFSVDNSIFRTFKDLCVAPEKVIDGYINGLRKRYINAFSYFAISLTATGLFSFIIKKFSINLLPGFSKESIDAGEFAFNFISEYQSFISFLSIPLIALISLVVFHNYKKYNYIEHIIIYLYAYSHITTIISFLIIAMSLLNLNPNIIMITSYGQFLIYTLYIGFTLKRLFVLSFKKILLKTLLFTLISSILLLVFSLLISLIAIKYNLVQIPN